MKAIKIYNIKWDFNNLTPEEKSEIKKNLPTELGFMADDDFNIHDKVPVLLRKKFNHDFITYSISEIPIFDTLEKLLHHCARTGETPKKFVKADGDLSVYCKNCYYNLKRYISERIRLEQKGTNPYNFPKILDEVMLSLEKITGISWDDNLSEEEWFEKLDEMIENIIKSSESPMTSKSDKTNKDDDLEEDEEDDDEDEEDDDEDEE